MALTSHLLAMGSPGCRGQEELEKRQLSDGEEKRTAWGAYRAWQLVVFDVKFTVSLFSLSARPTILLDLGTSAP